MDVLGGRERQLLAPQAVVKQHIEEDAIAPPLQVVAGGKPQEASRLGITERRGLAFVALHFGPADAFHRIVRHRVRVRKVLEQGRQGGELAADGAASESAVLEVLAPSEYVRASRLAAAPPAPRSRRTA